MKNDSNKKKKSKKKCVRYDDETERVFSRLKELDDQKKKEKVKRRLIIKRWRCVNKIQRQGDLLYASSPYTRKYNKYDFNGRRTKAKKNVLNTLIERKLISGEHQYIGSKLLLEASGGLRRVSGTIETKRRK